MRPIIQAAIATTMVATQAILPMTNIPVAETAKAADAAAVVTNNYTLKFSPQSQNAVLVQSTKGSFDTNVLAPLKAAQTAKAAADAEAAAQAAKVAAEQAAAATVVVAKATTPAPALTGSDAEYKLFIYNHESGNNPTRSNGSGCLGLGQACPGSKLLRVCPTLDYACEDAFFTNYAISRYGSWAGAYSFWTTHHWW